MFCRIVKKENNGGGEKLRAAECRCMYRKLHGKNLHLWVFCGDNIKYLLDFDKGNICKRKYELIQIFVSIIYKILKNRYSIIMGNYNGDFIF